MKIVLYDPNRPPNMRGLDTIRAHPWDTSAASPGERYIDLKEHPDMVEEALADLQGCRDHPTSDALVQLILDINGHSSVLETNDFLFRCPADNSRDHASDWMNNFLHLVVGRLMILYRDQGTNTTPGAIDMLGQSLAHHQGAFKRDAPFCIHMSPVATWFVDLPDQPVGQILVVDFWAWGNGADDTMCNLGVAVDGLHHAISSFNASQGSRKKTTSP